MSRLWDFFTDSLIVLFMPAVCSYFALSGNLFLNVAASNASGFEQAGNTILIPVQYLLAGQEAVPQEDGSWKFVQRFAYREAFWPKTVGSLIVLPPSLIVGCTLKSIGYLFEESRVRHASLTGSKVSTTPISHDEAFRSLGLDFPPFSQVEMLFSQGYLRKPGDENHLKATKEALAAVADVFNEARIPWWVDCGTCLGTYRYGGVIPWDEDIDIAILLPDFENARRALNRLDPRKYNVQDWSGRNFPGTLFKVFVKENFSQIDIDCFAIDSKKRELRCICTFEDSLFFPEWFKIREMRYSIPTAIDMVFPLKQAMFDGVVVFVPNKTKEYLQRVYGENLDPVKIYDPSTGRFEKDLSHPYWHRAYVH